jgi:hypothetical protein
MDVWACEAAARHQQPLPGLSMPKLMRCCNAVLRLLPSIESQRLQPEVVFGPFTRDKCAELLNISTRLFDQWHGSRLRRLPVSSRGRIYLHRDDIPPDRLEAVISEHERAASRSNAQSGR